MNASHDGLPARTGHDPQELMRLRVEDILLVASPYDCFILEEDGRLDERMLAEFIASGQRHAPGITRVSTGAEALARAQRERRFNLIVTSIHVGDMGAGELARQARAAGLEIPVVLLAFDNRELTEFLAKDEARDLERIFVWQGDVRILLAIVKYIEDRWNAPHDCGVAGVPLLLVVEDSVRHYSSFLPVIYTELLDHSERLLAEGANLTQKILRMQARPKVLLASTFEEAAEVVERYHEGLLGVIADVAFPLGGRLHEGAGVELARRLRALAPDVPVVLQSAETENAAVAAATGLPFLVKGSPTLLADLRRCLVERFGFGDFVFRLPAGEEVGRAADLRQLEAALRAVPAASIAHHAAGNHFSKWLRARADFDLAAHLRPRRVAEHADPEELRAGLLLALREYRAERARTLVADFDREQFDGAPGFYRIGGGSLGGKARGLAFLRRLAAEAGLGRRFPGVRVEVPSLAVVGTDVFDRFLDRNELRRFALECSDDAELRRRFGEADFPTETRADLRAFVARVRCPLAVRSSSLLEDSQYQPFTGVYETFMLPNRHPDPEVRLDALVRAIVAVYVSAFAERAKAYVRATPYRLEEEKMAVILQRVVGVERGARFYPDLSGVARSHNFYPVPPLRAEDGLVAAALGLGRTVVQGGTCLRFSPRRPQSLADVPPPPDLLEQTQRTFWALALREERAGMEPGQELREALFDLDAAAADGTLEAVASTYVPARHAIVQAPTPGGVPFVSFAPLLRRRDYPLAPILAAVLEAAVEGMAGPVELEFAGILGDSPGAAPHPEPELALLQLRPMALAREAEGLALEPDDREHALVWSTSVLGHGRLDQIRDLVVVDIADFDRARSAEAAAEVARLNAALTAARTPYILIGPGRWGSGDPWLGIPVGWEQISGARVIVESGFRDFRVTPSQGTHFFQNLTAFQVGYFTANPLHDDGRIDWGWLAAQAPRTALRFARHLRLDEPLLVKMDGRRREGVVLKPRQRPT